MCVKIEKTLEIPIDAIMLVNEEQTQSILAVAGTLGFFLIPTFVLLLTVLIIRSAVKKRKSKLLQQKISKSNKIVTEKQEKFNKKYKTDEDIIGIIPDYIEPKHYVELVSTIYFDNKGKIIKSGGKR